MLISHEVPLCLLEQSRSFNDYDYALVHLFEKYKEYFNFYKQSLLQGRYVLLDNSLFELESIFDQDKFVYWIEQLQPSSYIIPDSLENVEETITSCENFLNKFKDIPGEKIGVVQGKNEKELIDCYNFMSDNVDIIAISFDYSYYLTIADNYAEGRIKFIRRLLEKDILNTRKPHHFLGCYLPQEFKAYKNYKWLKTIDTSNPVVHAIKGISYTNEGLFFKERIKLVDLIETKIEDINLKLLKHNLSTFKSFCK